MKKLIGQGSGIYQTIKLLVVILCPSLAYYTRIPFFPIETQEFFSNIIKQSMKARKDGKTKINDFIDFFLDMAKNLEKDNKIEEVEAESEFEKNAAVKGEAPQILSEEELETMVIANGILVFFVGNDTTSTGMSIILFFLANHQDVQDKVYEELKVKSTYKRIQSKVHHELFFSGGH